MNVKRSFVSALAGCAVWVAAAVPANLSLINIQRTMKQLEESTAEKPAHVRVLFYGQSIVAQPWTKIVEARLTNRYPTVKFEFDNRVFTGNRVVAVSDGTGSSPIPTRPVRRMRARCSCRIARMHRTG